MDAIDVPLRTMRAESLRIACNGKDWPNGLCAIALAILDELAHMNHRALADTTKEAADAKP